MLLTIVFYLTLWGLAGSISVLAAVALISPKLFVETIETILEGKADDDQEWFAAAMIVGTLLGGITTILTVIIVTTILVARLMMKQLKEK